jgi:hypothetical protein
MSYFPNKNKISTLNSTDTLLNAAAVFTGTGEDVSGFNSVVVSVKTDQDGTYSVQFSNDNTNWDSVLTRYYRTAQIEPPHRFTITRKYCRIVFTNTSASNQTYLRLQTTFGEKSDLNIPTDSTMSQDYDSLSVRPTDYKYETALGRRQGSTTWNKWGYNGDIDIGTETIWNVGGLFVPIVTARTLSVVSTSANDTSAGTGARTVIIYGVDANWKAQTVTVTLNGTTPVVTAETWMGVNRMAIASAGSGQVNAGDITATATTEATVQAKILTGEGTSQQAFFFVQENHQALMDWLYITLVKLSGTQPNLTVKCWVISAVSNAKYEVFRDWISGDVENHSNLRPSQPFVVGEKSLVTFEATTDQNNTQVSCRFSLIEVRDVDAS